MNILKQIAGRLYEVATKGTSAGASDAGAVPHLGPAGTLDHSMMDETAVGGSASHAGRLVALDGSGRLASTLMPTGIGADTVSLPATENLAAGDWVNIYSATGTPSVRKADASSDGKEAHGFVLAAVASGAAATVYMEGLNSQCTGLTAGTAHLSSSSAGRATSTPPTTAGQVVQVLGVAVSATAVNAEIQPPIVLA